MSSWWQHVISTLSCIAVFVPILHPSHALAKTHNKGTVQHVTSGIHLPACPVSCTAFITRAPNPSCARHHGMPRCTPLHSLCEPEGCRPTVCDAVQELLLPSLLHCCSAGHVWPRGAAPSTARPPAAPFRPGATRPGWDEPPSRRATHHTLACSILKLTSATKQQH